VKVAEAMGLNTAARSPEQSVQSALDAIRGLVHDVGIVIEGFEVTDQVIRDLAQSAMTVQRLLQNNPRPIMLEDARKIYQTSLRQQSY
jgi:alcohol dehydrogenase class IV